MRCTASIVVPNSYMCRRATMAYLEISVCPHGDSNCDGPRDENARLAVRRRRLFRSARDVEP
jgi:hypothetical protein